MRPHLFNIDASVWGALSEEEVTATVNGLKDFNLYHLPYDDEDIILRIYHRSNSWSEIRGLREGEDFAWDMVFADKSAEPIDFKLEVNLSGGKEEVRCERLPIERDGRHFLHRFRILCRQRSKEEQQAHYRDGLIAILASRGIEKRTRDAKDSKLKKFGIGKLRNDYVTRIALSAQLDCGDADEARPGRPVRPHLRRGHARTQHYGLGNQQTKLIWIAPVFVNADEDFVSTRTAYRILH